MNTLWFGDNLHVMRRHLKDETVDLIYLDPPFNSNADYNVVFKAPSGRGHRAQIQAFEDTWHWGDEASQGYDELLEKGGAAAAAMRSLYTFLGPSDELAYLVMMGQRLVEMRRILKQSGSLFLHCDQTAAFHLKWLLDHLFGAQNFRKQIIWKRSTSHGNVTRGLGSLYDTLLYYTKSEQFTWNQGYHELDANYVRKKFTNTDPDGRRWQSVSLRNPSVRPNLQFDYEASDGNIYKPHPNGWAVGRERLEAYDHAGRLHFPAKTGGQLRVKQYLDERPGTKLQDLWTDIPALNSQARERLGYPTQTPLALMERIIAMASNEGDVVLDPFCGCGTTVHAAQVLNRPWIGIDVTHVAIHVIADRLGRWLPHAKFRIEGQPIDLAGAAELARIDKYQFQWWATWLCGGQPYGGERKGRDRGIDGTLEFASGRGEHDWGVISVKGGQSVGPAAVRDLHGTMDRENASLGVLICLNEPTREMEREALAAKTVNLGGQAYRRIQIRTVAQLLAGQAIECPFLLTTVQSAPGPSKGPRRVAVSPEELRKQKTLLFPIQGGKEEPTPSVDLFGRVPAHTERRRRA